MKLNLLRNQINQVDKKIISLLATRFSLVKQIVQLKRIRNLSAFDKKREMEVLRYVKLSGKTNGIDERFLEKIFQLILRYSKKIQKDLM